MDENGQKRVLIHRRIRYFIFCYLTEPIKNIINITKCRENWQRESGEKIFFFFSFKIEIHNKVEILLVETNRRVRSRPSLCCQKQWGPQLCFLWIDFNKNNISRKFLGFTLPKMGEFPPIGLFWYNYILKYQIIQQLDIFKTAIAVPGNADEVNWLKNIKVNYTDIWALLCIFHTHFCQNCCYGVSVHYI